MRGIRRMWNRPRGVLTVLVPVLVVTFALSGIGRDRTASEGGLYWVGASFWFAFGVTFVITVLYTVAQGIRLLVRRSPA